MEPPTKDVFQPVENARMADAVMDQLERLLLSGVLRPGDRLPAERDLAQSFVVSRPTLRVAIKDMEDRGLLVSRQGGGTYVANIIGPSLSEPVLALFAKHTEAFFDYLEFRRETESQAAYHAAMRATKADRVILTRIFEEMEAVHAAGDYEREAALDADFHMAIVDAAHNMMLAHVMRSIYELMRRGVFYNRQVLLERHGISDRLLEHHREIFNAIMESDGDRARAACEAHLDLVEQAMRLASDYDHRESVSSKRLEQMEQQARRRITKTRGRDKPTVKTTAAALMPASMDEDTEERGTRPQAEQSHAQPDVSFHFDSVFEEDHLLD